MEAHKNPDGFTESSSQTINLPLKNKDEMTSTNTTHEMACQAFSFEILDATSSVSAGTNEYNDGATTVEEDPAGLSPYIRQFVSETLSVSVATVGCLLDTSTLTRSSSHHSGDTNNSSKAKKVESVGSGSTNLGSNSRRNNNLGGMSIKNPGIAGNPSSLRPTLSRKSGLHGSNSEDPSKDHNYDKEIIVVQKPKFEVLLEKDTERILASKQLLRSLQVAERAVQQNAYHHKHLDYRDLPDGLTSPLLSSSLVDRRSESQQNTASSALLGFGLSAATENSLGNKKTKSQLSGQQAAQSKAGGVSKTAAGSASGLGSVRSAEEKAEEDEAAGETSGSSDASRATGKVHLLYSYRNNDLVRGRPVTSMCWNCVNLDLLTVGYGTCDTVVDPSRLGTAVDEELQGGLVLFWSLRNPDYPEKILRTPHAVTCLDFSKQTPSVLAVGLISGDVLVFDMRRQREGDWGIPVESSMGMSGTHSDPIW